MSTTHAVPAPPVAWPHVAVPVAVGVASAAGMLFALDGAFGSTTADTPATVVGVATLCYLAAAATGRRWMALVWCVAAPALVLAALLADVPWPAALAAAGVVLLAVGLATGREPAEAALGHPGRTSRRTVTWQQAAAMAAYLGAATVALTLATRWGLALAGLALTVHAAWDVVHWRRDVVVHRALAMWCLGLDVTLGVTCVALAVTG